MIHIVTKMGPRTVVSKRGENYWNVSVYDKDGKVISDFGMMCSRNMADMGENHLKMTKKVLMKSSYYSGIDKPLQFF